MHNNFAKMYVHACTCMCVNIWINVNCSLHDIRADCWSGWWNSGGDAGFGGVCVCPST